MVIFMTVYVDVLVAINIFVNYFLLLSTKGILKINIKRLRLFLGAFAGGLYSLVIFLPDIPNVVSLIMNVAACTVIVLVTFTPKCLKSFIKEFAAFFAVNFIFAGLMLAVWFAFRPESMVYNNAVVYFDIDIKILVISTVACYLVLTVISFFLKRAAPSDRLFDITLTNKGRTIMTKALLDTGNSLKDGFTGKPVIIADKKTVRKLVDEKLYDFFDGNTALKYSGGDGLRLIPYNTVGVSGVLRATVIDSITIHKKNLTLKNVLLAESVTEFANDEYSVLLNNDIINERGGDHAAEIFEIFGFKG